MQTNLLEAKFKHMPVCTELWQSGTEFHQTITELPSSLCDQPFASGKH